MNNQGTSVRKPRRKAPVPTSKRAAPSRSERTQRALGEALVGLMHERPFEEITVQDVLDRARIGRATFYAHFRNKNDLFLSGYERMLASMEAHLTRATGVPGRVAPVAEFFSHVAGAERLVAALRASGQIDSIWKLGAAHFAKIIERRLAVLAPPGAMSRALAARLYAAALMEMLEWWLDRQPRLPAERMDKLFHDFVFSAGREAAADTLSSP
jgi:AcrR family transcriptional regulator